MIVSCEILIFVNPCSNMIEMKMFVLNGTILQNKISPMECQNQNIFITDKIGGSLSVSLETLDHWENVLTSTKRCPGPCHTGSTSNGNHHGVLPPFGGNRVDPRGLPKNSKKVNQRGCMQRFMIERCNPLSTDLWVKPQTNGLHEFIFIVLYFVADRSFTADGGLL